MNDRAPQFIGFLFAAFAFVATPYESACADDLPKVESPPKPVTEQFHGTTTVVDPFQWLENPTTPEVRQWVSEENKRTRTYFDRLPYREGIAEQLKQLRGEESARFGSIDWRQGRYFALRFKPPAQQPVLVRLNSLEPPALWRAVFDPNLYNTNGTTAIDWYVPSLDGKRVAISLSENGSEQGTLHIFDVESGKEIGDVIPRVQYPTGGGSAAWLPDGSGILYTRYPHEGERPEADINFFQQVWFHRIGTNPSEDKLEIGKEFPRIAEIALDSSDDGQWILATVANGDGGEFAHYVRNASGQWRQVTQFSDAVKAARFGRDGALYLLSTLNAPHGKILRVPLDSLQLAKATVVVPERKGVIEGFAPHDHGVYLADLMGGPSELSDFRAGSTKAKEIPVLPISTVAGLNSWVGDTLLFGNVSYVKPFAWYTLGTNSMEPHRTALYMTSPVDFEDIEVVREFATSKDGTKVPVNIMRKKGTKLDGQNPTLLYGYGGYGINLTPGFDSTRRIWFDAGGVYAVANLRGGGEYGEEWHKAGNLTRKQHVFDDFIAAAEHLVQRHYTSPEHLAVEGGSNGGLLMGAFLTQKPELARAVVSHVGIYDMLRVELDANGQFNITEFGTVKDPEQFKALYAYSPFHHVAQGTKYPAVLLTTGDNDGRVNPAQSRKMAAALQTSTGSAHPILFRSTAAAGHGIGTSLKERIAEQADVYSFLFHELGVDAAGGTRSEALQFLRHLASCQLYTFVDAAYLNGRDPFKVARSLCEGGSDIIQLRAKDWPVARVDEVARSMAPLLKEAGVYFVINDYPAIAQSVGADLCHLGQEDFFDAGFTRVADLSSSYPGLQIGLSTHAPAQAERAVTAGPAYVAIGPVYATGTKPTARPVTLDYVRWASTHVTLPWFAIGGINLQNLSEVMAAGATRVCVVSAILNSGDIANTCRAFKTALASLH